MRTVLANAEISFKGIEILEREGYKIINQHYQEDELINIINQKAISVLYISFSDLTEQILTECPHLEVIGFHNTCDCSELMVKYPKIQFINPDNAHSQAVAELVFAHLLGMVRFLYDANRQMPLEGEINFDGMHQAYSNGTEIKGKILGIIGFGPEAKATIKMAISLGLEVMIYDKNMVSHEFSIEFPYNKSLDFEIKASSFEEVIMKSDFISTHISKEDDIIIGKEEFELMKMGVCLINTSEAGIIDEVELLKAIDSGIVKHAALDCFDNQPKPDMRILMNPNISLSPNIAKLTQDTLIKVGETFAKSLIEIK